VISVLCASNSSLPSRIIAVSRSSYCSCDKAGLRRLYSLVSTRCRKEVVLPVAFLTHGAPRRCINPSGNVRGSGESSACGSYDWAPRDNISAITESCSRSDSEWVASK